MAQFVRLLQESRHDVKLATLCFGGQDSVFLEASCEKRQVMKILQGSCTVLFDGHAGRPGAVGQPAAYGDIHRHTLKDTQSCRSLHPSPAVRRHFGKLKWKWIHNGHLALKSCGNNIGQAKGCPAQCVRVHVCVRVYEWFMLQCNTKARTLRIALIWRLEVVNIMFDRILASKHSLMDKGNNYLSFMCLRFLFSPLLLLLNMFLC